MAALRKRKHAAVEEPAAGKATRSTKLQKCINGFGHVSKPNEDEIVVEVKKIRQASGQKAQVSLAVQNPPALDKKRKRRAASVVEDEDESNARVPRQQAPHTPSTPRSKRLRNVIPPSPARSAAALFDKLDINARSSFASADPAQDSYGTPPATPENDDFSALPHLRTLYSSFLSALSLHYAHNGTSSPVNMQVLLPMVTKSWQKRSVNLDDLRLLLAINDRVGSCFSIRDYGRAGICVSLTEPTAGPLNEELLNTRFDHALQQAWKEWNVSASTATRTAEAFLDQIPLASIPKHESVAKAAQLFARGEQRLADLKASSAAAQLASSPKSLPAQAASQRSAQATTNRGSALLDRILAKQTLASTLPAGPTRAQLERRAALDRIEDIARVLFLLAGSRERASFSMAIATQHLQQSLRSPISSAEVQRCLALMATEVMPEFVKIVMSEGVHGVVVSKSGNLGLAELRARLERAAV